MTPEKKVQNKIEKYLDELISQGIPIYYERRQAQGVGYKYGLPDLFLVINGIHVEVEVKAPNGDVRAAQEKWEMRFKNLGILYTRPHSLEEFKNFIFNELPNMLK